MPGQSRQRRENDEYSSDESHESGNSSASYESVDLVEQARSQPSLQRSSRPVPDNAPDLPAGAHGVYLQQNRGFYAIHAHPNAGHEVHKYNHGTGRWVKENWDLLIKALGEFMPIVMQGASTLANESPAARATQIAGAAFQVGYTVLDGFAAVQEYRAGAPINSANTALTAGRVASAAASVAAAAVEQGTPTARGLSLTGTAFSAFVVGTNLGMQAYDRTARANPTHQQGMYAAGFNAELGTAYEPVSGSLPSVYDTESNSASAPSSHSYSYPPHTLAAGLYPQQQMGYAMPNATHIGMPAAAYSPRQTQPTSAQPVASTSTHAHGRNTATSRKGKGPTR
ncbi:hypothetical protein [Streptomyces sp. NPDC046909]|uniref:hypothetical protein n=1 Tax=Streptomyces sp. NPDC046909 TaxID=3155617 RepID=UPI0033CA4B0B